MSVRGKHSNLTFIDLFAGAGGKSCGFEQAGFRALFATDINQMCADTYLHNRAGFPKTRFLTKDIRDIHPQDILNITGMKKGQIDVICGGPPCQGFSLAGRRDPTDRRNTLFQEYVKIVKYIKPKIFVMENVVGILSMKINGKKVKDIIKDYFEPDYSVDLEILNAADYGVPQLRERVFFVGNRIGTKNPFPEKHLTPKKYVSVQSAISDLEDISSGQLCNHYRSKARSNYQAERRKNCKYGGQLFNHEASQHTKKVIARFSMLPEGGGMESLPDEWKTKKRNVLRLKASEPAKTVVTLPDDFVHYNRPRILTVREMARLQSFDDDYIFLGKRTTGGLRRRVECPQYTQVGNAVPPLMAKAVAMSIKELF